MAPMPEIAELMNCLARVEGSNNTPIPGIRILKSSIPHPRRPLMYKKGIIIVGQGAKQIFLGGKVYEYNPANYLVLSLPIPAECQSLATAKDPMLAMFVDIPMTCLRQVVQKMGLPKTMKGSGEDGKSLGLFLSQMTPQINSTILRLLTALQSPVECKILGEGLVRELIFRIMCSENAHSLYALATRNTDVSRVDRAFKTDPRQSGADHACGGTGPSCQYESLLLPPGPLRRPRPVLPFSILKRCD